MVPAVGQGALAIEARADDEATLSVVSQLDHKFSRLACLAERSLLRALGGGCLLPIGAHAVVRDKRIRLEGLVADRAGTQVVRRRLSGSITEPEELGAQLANDLLENGAGELLARDAEVNG
jgi:hydroxymethylbilane synthase